MKRERLNWQFLLGPEVAAIHLHDPELRGVMRFAGGSLDLKDSRDLIKVWYGTPNKVANSNP